MYCLILVLLYFDDQIRGKIIKVDLWKSFFGKEFELLYNVVNVYY